MRYCLNCNRITAGQPLFCNFCGRSYDVKLCPSRHVNPRSAEVCSECGARDFSTPAPTVPLWLIPALWALKLFPGVLLLLVSILFFFATIHMLLSAPDQLFRFLLLALGLGMTWYLYMQLPVSVWRLFHTGRWGRRKRGQDHRQS